MIIIILIAVFTVNYLIAKSQALSIQKTAKSVSTSMDKAGYENKEKENLKTADGLIQNGKYKDAKNMFTEITKNLLLSLEEKIASRISKDSALGNDTTELQSIKKDGDTFLQKGDYVNSYLKFHNGIELIKKKDEENIKKTTEAQPQMEKTLRDDAALVSYKLNKDYKIKNITFLLNGEWAVAKITPITITTDDANIALKKVNNNWTIALGPGTAFEESDSPDTPRVVIDTLNK